jgi:hypothetical protein
LRRSRFCLCGDTKAVLLAWVARLLRELAAPLEIQPLVRPLAATLLTLLRLLDSFAALGAKSHLAMRCAPNRLDRVRFDPKFGGNFAVALSNVVDALLKRGNAFQSQVKQAHIVALLKLVHQKDIFVSAH